MRGWLKWTNSHFHLIYTVTPLFPVERVACLPINFSHLVSNSLIIQTSKLSKKRSFEFIQSLFFTFRVLIRKLIKLTQYVLREVTTIFEVLQDGVLDILKKETKTNKFWVVMTKTNNLWNVVYFSSPKMLSRKQKKHKSGAQINSAILYIQVTQTIFNNIELSKIYNF